MFGFYRKFGLARRVVGDLQKQKRSGIGALILSTPRSLLCAPRISSHSKKPSRGHSRRPCSRFVSYPDTEEPSWHLLSFLPSPKSESGTLPETLLKACLVSRHQEAFFAPLEFPSIPQNRVGEASGDPALGFSRTQTPRRPLWAS